MKARKVYYLLVLLLVSTSLLKAQNLSIRTSTGFAGFGTPVDGYYFSFDVGIPVFKGVEIAPTFAFLSKTKHKEFKMAWYQDDFQTDRYNYDLGESIAWAMGGTMKLYLILNPFKWLPNQKWNKVDFGIGPGYGLTMYSTNYFLFDADKELRVAISNSGIKPTLSQFKVFYNYHFKKCFVGVLFGVDEIWEEVTMMGLQFGIKVH